jgi:hypothetical protein
VDIFVDKELKKIMPVRNYTYYDYTISLCPECLKRVGAKIIIEDEAVFMTKRCPDHGFLKLKLLLMFIIIKTSETIIKLRKCRFILEQMEYGCPYDCGFVLIMSNIAVFLLWKLQIAVILPVPPAMRCLHHIMEVTEVWKKLKQCSM